MLLSSYILALLVLNAQCIGNHVSRESHQEFYTVEEYFVEHEISSKQAKKALEVFDLDSVESNKAGCQPCNPEEIRYCLGPHLMNDHCCCDKRYNEYFPYVPHTCYIGEKLCKPIAKDCAEYTRLRTCCCDEFVLEKWKSKSTGSNYGNRFIYINFIILLNFLLQLYIL